jgi:catechol 2,3-dioxygenase-like lactoylglutathione lyase family enzyme
VLALDDQRPVFNHINLVVHDMAAMVEFYERLGVEIAPTIAPWDRHHRTFSATSITEGFDFDLDSAAFATQWNQGWPPDQTGPVLGFRLTSAEAVDQTYRDLTSAGYVGQQHPYDGFMGARYAVVADPDGNSVGLMSPIDPSRSTIPPPPEE